MADEPAPQATTPATQQTAPPVVSGPWAADLQAAISDPQVLATVDQYMRTKVQPRVTQLEQEVAQAADARRLWDAFQADPVGTYVGIAKELYGDEAAQAIYSTLQGPPAPGTPEPVAQVQQPASPSYDPATSLSPDEITAWRQQQELAAYDGAVADVLGKPENADIDGDLFHTFVAAADGNFGEAVDRYRAHTAATLARFGIDPTQATQLQQQQAATIAEAEQRQVAPAVMGAEAGAGAAPPTTPQYRGQEGLERAIDDAMNLMVQNREAPPVA